MVVSWTISSLKTHPLEHGLSFIEVKSSKEVGVSVLFRGLSPSLCNGIPRRTELSKSQDEWVQ